jgi:hypothetical protein
MHDTIRDVPEPMSATIGANGQVIRADGGIIVTPSANGVALRQVGHGNPNIASTIDPAHIPVCCSRETRHCE